MSTGEPSPQPSTPLPTATAKTLEQVMREKAPDVLANLSQKQKQKLTGVRIEQFTVRVGPLPDPSELAAYNATIPNGADRIMKMAEAQSAHRLEMERLVITSQ